MGKEGLAETHVEIRPFLGRREAKVAARAGAILEGASSKKGSEELKVHRPQAQAQVPFLPSPPHPPPAPSNPQQRPSGVGSAPRSRGGAGCRAPPPRLAVPRSPANPPRGTGGGCGGGVKA